MTSVARGWVEVEVVPQEGRPGRKVYHITEQGREELRRWLTTPLPPVEHRHASLIQVFFAGQLSDEEILEMFEREAEQTRARLAPFDRIPQESRQYAEMVNSPREEFYWMLTLECGIHSAQAQLAWLESVIERIKGGLTPAS